MTNWRSEHMMYHCGRALVLLIHCGFSIYVWDFLLSLPADWRAFRARSYGLGTCLYLLCRYTTLISLVLFVRGANAMDEDVNCQTLMYAAMSMGFTAVSCASGLLYLRVLAVSNYNRIIAWGMGIGYIALWGLVGLAIYRARAVYIPELFACVPVQFHKILGNMAYHFAYDVVCLAIMLAYLLRMHHGGDLWTFLLHQGVVAGTGICAAYLYVVIFIGLDLNDPMNTMGFLVILVVTTLCATRMQRGLCAFLSGTAGTPVPVQMGMPPSSFLPNPTVTNPSIAINPGAPVIQSPPPCASWSMITAAKRMVGVGGVRVTVDMDVRGDDDLARGARLSGSSEETNSESGTDKKRAWRWKKNQDMV